MSQFGYILLFAISSAVLLILMLALARILAPKRPNPEKNKTYESGEEAIGEVFIKFDLRFFLIALVFILFDVELVLLFPWATVFSDKSLVQESQGQWLVFSGLEVLLFIFVLSLGLVYAWAKGHLDWVRPKNHIPKTINPAPKSLYEKINKKYKQQTP